MVFETAFISSKSRILLVLIATYLVPSEASTKSVGWFESGVKLCYAVRIKVKSVTLH